MSTKRVVAGGGFILLIALILFLCLFGNSSALRNWDVSGLLLRELVAVFRDPGTQWMVFLCVTVYCVGFLSLRHRQNARRFFRSDNPVFWLAVFLSLTALIYSFDYTAASRSTQALTLAGSIAFGLGFQVCSNWHLPKSRWIFLTPTLLICFPLIAAFWRPEIFQGFEYRGRSRLSGPWNNPNTFGLLMGTGVALAVGSSMRGWLIEDGRWKGFRKWICVVLCLVAAILMGRALFHSLSRGAWLATGCGLAYLLWHWINREIHKSHESNCSRSSRGDKAPSPKCGIGTRESELDRASSRRLLRWIERFHFSCNSCDSWFKRNWLTSSVVAISLLLLMVWHFRHTEWHAARRALSVGNLNDFSWRNRVAAWEGALQMMAERPWFGFGWNQAEMTYDQFYLMPRLAESAAIQMNDYLLLGATLGVPALFCFGIYLGLTFRDVPSSKFQVPSSKQPSSILDPPSSQWLAATCRSGAIVLLVGFWFDGGLFKLATASTFWILLELGRIPKAEKLKC
jgi:hypothetical protein